MEQKPEFLDYNIGLGLKGAGWETSLRSFNKISSLQLALLTKVRQEGRERRGYNSPAAEDV